MYDKLIVFGDSHFYANPSKSYIKSSGRSSWFQRQLDIAETIFNQAEDMGVKTIIHNGDLFHEKTRINIGLYTDVWQFFKKQSDKGFNIILNTGNHDLLTYNDSALQPFSDICKVISEPTIIKTDDTNLVFIPYGQEEDNLELPTEISMFNILFTHTDISGLKYGPTDYESGAPLKYQLLSDWGIIFNSHIHKPQELNNIVNVGSWLITDWGEVNENKRIILYEKEKWESIPINGPEFITLDRLTDKSKAKIATNSVDFFRIDVDSEQLIDPIFHQYNVFPRVTKTKKREIRLRETENVDDEIRKYVEIIDSKLNKKKLLGIGLEIYNGAN